MPLQPAFGGLGQSEDIAHGCVQKWPFALKSKQSFDWQSVDWAQAQPKPSGPASEQLAIQEPTSSIPPPSPQPGPRPPSHVSVLPSVLES
jgi:hypothetical protein